MQKSRFLWFLLIASLALNVFFVGGALYYRMTAGALRQSPEARLEYLADRLNLNDSQAVELKKTREAVIALREDKGNDWSERRKAIWAMIAAPSFDAEAMRALLNDGRQERTERWIETSRLLHDFLVQLSPEQRAAFLEMAQDRDFFRRFFRSDKRGD